MAELIGKKNRFQRTSAGASTLELLIAFAIFILILSAVIVVSDGNQKMNAKARISEDAVSKAKAYLESAAEEDFDSLDSKSEADGIYTKEIQIVSLSNFAKEIKSQVRDSSGAIVASLSLVVSKVEGSLGEDTCDLYIPKDWSHPNILHTISDSAFDTITGIDILHDKIYVATNSSTVSKTDFHIVDISDLSHVKIASIDTGPVLNKGPGLNALDVAGDYAYVANSSVNGQLEVIDISDSTKPEVKAVLKLPVAVGIAEDRTGESISYANGKIYLGTNKSDATEFNIIDVSDPLHPMWLGGFETGTLVNDIRVVGATAYLATASSDQVWTLDVSDPSHIQKIQKASLPQWLTQSGKSLDVVGDILYLGRTYGGGRAADPELYMFDLPALIVSGSKSANSSVNDMFVRSGLAFLATNDSAKEFEVWSVAASTDMHASGSLNLDSEGVSVDCEGSRLYLATGSSIQVIENSL